MRRTHARRNRRNDRRASHVKPEANAGIARRSRTDRSAPVPAAVRPAAPPASVAPSAAAPSAAASAAPSEAAAEPVTIDWWHITTGDPGKADFQAIADAYTAAHPNVKINITVLENEAFKTKLAATAGGRVSGPVPVVGRRRPWPPRPTPACSRTSPPRSPPGRTPSTRGDEHLPVQGRPVRRSRGTWG